MEPTSILASIGNQLKYSDIDIIKERQIAIDVFSTKNLDFCHNTFFNDFYLLYCHTVQCTCCTEWLLTKSANNCYLVHPIRQDKKTTAVQSQAIESAFFQVTWWCHQVTRWCSSSCWKGHVTIASSCHLTVCSSSCEGHVTWWRWLAVGGKGL